MIEENKHCSEVIKKHFNKELVMTIELNVGSVAVVILIMMLK